MSSKRLEAVKQGGREILNKRTVFTKDILLDKKSSNGKNVHRMVCSMAPLHYKDAQGKMQDIDPEVSTEGVASKVRYKGSFDQHKYGYSFIDEAGTLLSVELLGTVNAGGKVTPVGHKPAATDKNIASWDAVGKDLDFKVIFEAGRVKLFRTLKSDKAPRKYRWRIIREKGTKSRVLFNGWDKRQRAAEVNVTVISESDTVVDGRPCTEFILEDEWTGRVKVQDKVTRKRTWSDKPEYPVVIDPTISTSITTGADDGVALTFDGWSMPPSVSLTSMTISKFTSLSCSRGFMRFPVAGLAQGSIIVSALLKVHRIVEGRPGTAIDVFASDASDPAALTTATTAIPRVMGMTNKLTTSVTGAAVTGTGSETPTSNTWHPITIPASDVDVTSLVSALVSQYDYTNAHMLFMLRENPVSSGIVLAPSERTPYKPVLVIEYEAGGPEDKTTYDFG